MIVTAEKISKASLFKLIFTWFSLGMFAFFLVCGTAAIFGAETVHFENQPITGIKGFIAAMIMWPIFSFFITAFFWLFGVLGLWFYSFYKPLTVRFKGKIETQLTDV